MNRSYSPIVFEDQLIRHLSPSLVWFRVDLRLDDNHALLAAVERQSPLIPVYIWAPEEEEPWPPGGASRWWLDRSLHNLQKQLEDVSSRLIIRRGPSLETLDKLFGETGAKAVFWNRRYEPAAVVRDTAIKEALRTQGIHAESFNGATLFEPWAIRSKSTQKPFQIFSAFWKACLDQTAPAAPQDAPKHLNAPASWPASLALDDLELKPRINWASGFEIWKPGEAGAHRQLANFLKERVADYPRERDLPAHPGTSRISPHLHFGEISPSRIWHALRKARGTKIEAADVYLREIGWREFAHHLLFHFPKTTNEPLRTEFAAFPWRTDRLRLEKWQRGETGYPIVDAGMRELWTTGWMHNRVRMIVASFLTKHLRINWQEGAYWFWDTLVDADLANNTLGWQWTAGSGADAAPYFRIFSPMRQSEKFDSDGEYIRRWVPELKRLPSPAIHSPWMADVAVLNDAGVKLGKTYPQPIVDHETARREALEAFEQVRRRVTVTSRRSL